jgi:glutamine amidotransferase
MNELKARNFDSLVLERVASGIPLLGICVGMQMLFQESDEFGETPGLGFLPGRVRRFADLLVPCVGWNQVRACDFHPLLKDIEDGSYFYFVHSYYCDVDDPMTVVGKTDYGIRYASIIAQGDLFGVQFHPEKSQAVGLKLLANFAHRVRFNVWQ